jgi:hypothetical protein
MDIEFDKLSNLPYLLAYFGNLEFLNYSKNSDYEDEDSEFFEDEEDEDSEEVKNSEFDERMKSFFDIQFFNSEHMTGIRIKRDKTQEKIPIFEIRYHQSSIDALINHYYKYDRQPVDGVKCSKCGHFIELNQRKDKKDVYGLLCDWCVKKLKFRYFYEFLSEFYDAEQASLKEETENKENKKQEGKSMTIKSTIIGFVLEDGGMYKIYNPETNQLANLTAADFDSLCLGEFPYRKIRANTLANNEIVETLDGKIYYVSDAKKNEMFDFATGKIERSAVVTNLMVNTNCYVKYVPVLKKYCTFADVAAGNVDPRIAKMIEVISNDIQSGGEAVKNNIVAKLVRFLVDPEYADLLDTETLNDMVMADAQAFTVMSQMTNMQMAKSIMSGNGAIPLSVQSQVVTPAKTYSVATPTEIGSADCVKLDGEDEAEYKQRVTMLMEEAVKNCDYEAAAKYQKILRG